ncbi:nuclear transport factor 2 family protein [Ralstonia pseudosolanacearum]|uniref:nuclear transport factor 2 family protein n=1 Tax=Ralstonia pseudosolanacearum TaxID=1310165 RepID=UPI001FF8CBC4|nr:nuclear transport factor 2 family protein [Ralstonia pseudosolanacearum]
MTQPIPAALAAPARATLEAWHVMLASGNMDALDTLFAKDVVFRSPVAHTPYPGRNAAALLLRTVATVFEAFRYHRGFATDDGASVVLEFSAAVAGKSLKGVDLIRFDADGKIIEFEVMVRPASGLQALGAAMGAKLGDQVGRLKTGA